MDLPIHPNALYYGDCLEIMRNFPAEYVDLICLDPPFNSNRRYNTIFKNSGLSIDPQIKAFDDIWVWDEASAQRVEELKNAAANPASKVIAGFEHFIPESQMLSYTSYMAQRLFETHRILKPTGSIYLHCDPTASHYLKCVMDAIFGEKNFRNEIVWCYTGPSNTKRWFPRKHDIILFYAKSDAGLFNADAIRVPYSESFILRRRYAEGESGITAGYSEGREDKEINASFGRGKIIEDYWTDIPAGGQIPKQERLGYPTQKPLVLYERIVKASSNQDDLVLDPFSGCGTTIEAARKLKRNAIGIDILPFALRLINQHRIVPHGFEPLPIYGVPVDMQTAVQLAKSDAFKFQDWAISLIDGLAANPKKTDDAGIDGYGMLLHKPDNVDRKAIVVQVTGAAGSQRAKFDRLQTTIRNHNAAMGILITRNAQTARKNWKHDLESLQMGNSTYDPIHCFSIEEYYQHGERWEALLNLPPLANPWTGKPMQKTLFEVAETSALF